MRTIAPRCHQIAVWLSGSSRFTILFVCLAVSASFAQIPADDYTGLVEEGRRALGDGHAEVAAASFQEALDKMQPAGAPPSKILNVLVGLSTAWLDSGDISRAERTLLKAGLLLEKNHDDVTEAEITNGWAAVHVRLGRYAQARAEVNRVLQKLEKSPAAAKLVPTLLDSLASAEIYLGQYPQALAHQQSAVDKWRAFLPVDDASLIRGYTTLATAQYLSGRLQESRASMETAITAAAKTYGTHCPLFGHLLQNEIIVLNRLGLRKEIKARERQLKELPQVSDSGPGIYTRAASREPVSDR